LIRVGFVSMVLALPLIGAVLAGRDAREFLRFPPPLNIPTDYLRFSWLAAAAVFGCVIALARPWLLRLPAFRNPGKSSRGDLSSSGERFPSSDDRLPGTAGGSPASEWHNEDPPAYSRQRFPIWGTAALIWALAWWVLAWTRWDWFAPLQRYTFFPLWVGFIVFVNAAIQQRTGSCLMRRFPRRWCALFGLSALCWWGFEWLNRFVENWHYLGAEGFGPASYAVHATLCFSTVLPAVGAIAEWIGSHPRWINWTVNGPRWSWMEHRSAAVALVAGGGVALVCTGMFPRWSYPALWVAPLALFISVPVLTGRRGVTHEMARGDWSRAMTWMIASLACGFFWELWNWHSEAKWIYTVPGVERWHLFEMPALGYAGYLPFGLECLLVIELFACKSVRANEQEPGS
jgi:hypothetical protein